MIGYLSGQVIDKRESSAIVLCGEVGYEVNLPASELMRIKIEEKATYYIYTHVREDILALYGFRGKEELEFFKMLLSVSGIGPKVALAIISSAPIGKLKESISKGDPALLSAVSGVGKKTAEKAVVELRGKMTSFSGGALAVDDRDDVVSALVGLGFQRPEIAEALKKLPGGEVSPESRIKELIKIMGRKL